MIRENRIRYYAAADYTEGSQIDRLVKSIIDVTQAESRLDAMHEESMRQAALGEDT